MKPSCLPSTCLGIGVASIIIDVTLNLFTLLQEELKLSPRVEAAYREVSNYQDLLWLGDLATITQEKRPFILLDQRRPNPLP